ncbi:MAG: rubredoxin-like domain-containing protein, partial [Haloplanus sp.]
GLGDEGFYVTTDEGVDALSVEHERAGHEFGEAELMWRCFECGAMGDVTEMPEECPDCGAPREDLYYWTED